MGRKATGRPPGRQRGSGTLGLSENDAQKRVTIRIPQSLYDRLEAFAAGRHYTRRPSQLAGSVREAIAHWLSCPNKRQTVNVPAAPPEGEEGSWQTVNVPAAAIDTLKSVVAPPPEGEDGSWQTVNVPAAAIVAPPPEGEDDTPADSDSSSPLPVQPEDGSWQTVNVPAASQPGSGEHILATPPTLDAKISRNWYLIPAAQSLCGHASHGEWNLVKRINPRTCWECETA